MNQPKNKEHDFSAKLRQSSVIEALKQYVTWQRASETPAGSNSFPHMAPISINLDLTTACNFDCPHCVDSEITNIGKFLDSDNVKKSLDTLKSHGLLSVILLGGGEPTLYSDFIETVRYIKSMGLQLGIVTNGSRLERVAEVAGLLEKRDWLRLSLDAASQETFDKLHRPKKPVSLPKILKNARDIKARNPNVSLGYSYVIMWDGLSLNGHPIAPNLQEMPEAAELAAAYDFDYISFKPCLIRLPDVQRETLLDSVEKEKEQRIIDNIRQTLEDTRNAVDGRIKVLESVNLVAMVNNKVHELKKQPETCHMQIFNTVVTPMGIYHCPAFRGVENAKIAGPDGYAGEERFNETLQRLTDSITSFNATRECNRIACFYNHVNWWIENFIESEKSVDELEEAEDDNFFF